MKRQLAAIALGIILLSACSKTAESPQAVSQESNAPDPRFGSPEPSTSANTSQELVSQDGILQAQANRDRKVEVLFSSRVGRLLPDDTKGLPHQQFLVDLNNGSRVKIAHDIKYAPRVPIQPGDTVTIKGEFIWNRKGGVVHWTHHSDTPRHEGGYIDFGGKRYE